MNVKQQCTKCLGLFNLNDVGSFTVFEVIPDNRSIRIDFCTVNCLTLWYIDARNDTVLWSNE